MNHWTFNFLSDNKNLFIVFKQTNKYIYIPSSNVYLSLYFRTDLGLFNSLHLEYVFSFEKQNASRSWITLFLCFVCLFPSPKILNTMNEAGVWLTFYGFEEKTRLCCGYLIAWHISRFSKQHNLSCVWCGTKQRLPCFSKIDQCEFCPLSESERYLPFFVFCNQNCNWQLKAKRSNWELRRRKKKQLVIAWMDSFWLTGITWIDNQHNETCAMPIVEHQHQAYKAS
jgi:hypothetical protein